MVPETVSACFPKRPEEAFKGTFGRVMVYAGSYGMMGAAVLAAKAAQRTGAGLVYIAAPRSLVPYYNLACIEAVVLPYEEKDGTIAYEAMDVLLADSEKITAFVIGPGLGVSDTLRQCIVRVLRETAKPVILDADGINNLTLQDLMQAKAPLIMTPHFGEMARLLGYTVRQVMDDQVSLAKRVANELQSIVVLKGHRTIVTDGSTLVRNETGNPGLATAGSGDVLSGVIASIAGMGNTPLESAIAGVYIHGLAGDAAAQEKGEYGMIASDILQVLPDAIKRVQRNG